MLKFFSIYLEGYIFILMSKLHRDTDASRKMRMSGQHVVYSIYMNKQMGYSAH